MDENTHPSGVDEGTVLETTTHEGDQVKEKIVYDTDGSWHKEVVS